MTMDQVVMLAAAFFGSGSGVVITQKVMQAQLNNVRERIGEMNKSLTRAHDRITDHGREISELKGKASGYSKTY